jgi:hypothetical protein
MTRRRFIPRGSLAPLAALAGLVVGLAAAPAGAQSAGKGFLFQEPLWTFAIRGGFERANANSDIFDFVTDELTLDRGDFSGLNVSVDLAYRMMPRLDLAFSAGYAGSKTPSEFRRYVGTDDLPITQTTKFVRVPVTASVKAYLAPRGEKIGSLAWIPSRFAPYIGAGGGAMHFTFQQEGEFVDVDSPNLDIFRDRLTSRGWTPTAHGLAGLDVALSPRLGLTTEARYTWARADMGSGINPDFQEFGRIDLSGFSATMGLNVRF